MAKARSGATQAPAASERGTANVAAKRSVAAKTVPAGKKKVWEYIKKNGLQDKVKKS